MSHSPKDERTHSLLAAGGSDMGRPTTVDALVSAVSDRIQHNLDAYGKAWTGEDEDTEFICGPLLQEIQRLKDALLEVPKNYVPAEERDRWLRRALTAEAEIERLREAGFDLLAHPRSARTRNRMDDALGSNPFERSRRNV